MSLSELLDKMFVLSGIRAIILVGGGLVVVPGFDWFTSFVFFGLVVYNTYDTGISFRNELDMLVVIIFAIQGVTLTLYNVLE